MIEWCNLNGGFLSAILSVVGLLLSAIAIVVSIQTARLPYSKKIKVSSSSNLLVSDVGVGIAGMSVNLLNCGHRDICVTKLGFAVKKNHELQYVVRVYDSMDFRGILHPTEVKSVDYSVDDLSNFLALDKKTKLYAYAADTEGNEYKRYIGRAKKIAEVHLQNR